MLSSKPVPYFILGLWTAAYFALGKLSLSLALPPAHVSVLWPAAGMAVGICLLYGMRAWPVIMLGATMANAAAMVPLAAALMIAFGNTLSGLAIAWLIKRHTRIDRHFCDGKDVFKFVAFACAGSLISAAIGPAALLAAGLIASNQYPGIWLTWFMGDITGILIVAPAVITWRNNAAQRWSRRKRIEFAFFVAAFCACSLIVAMAQPTPVLFPLLALMIWLAFRFSQSDVALANIVLASIAMAGTLHSDPLHRVLFDVPVSLLQLFISVTSITALVLAVTVDERSRVARGLAQLKDQLESLVAQRTWQLSQTTAALQRDIAVRETIQKRLQSKERQLEEAQRLARLGSWQWDVATDCMTMSTEMRSIYGVLPDGPATLTYAQYLDYVPKDERHLVAEVVQAAMTRREPINYQHHIIRADGEWRFLNCRGSVDADADGKPVRLFGTCQDLTEEKTLEDNLRAAEERYRKLVELSPDAIYLLHDGHYAFSNDAGIKLLGATQMEQVRERPFLDFIAAESKPGIEQILQQLPQQHPMTAIEARAMQLDGSNIDIELAATPFAGANTQDILLVARDISERKRSEQQIQHMAHHDTLTGLANRVLFNERLEHAIAQSHRLGKTLYVLFIDLDRFKGINDTSGHDAGDQVLRECAQRLKTCLRDSDTVARAGGDEFLILIESAIGPADVPAIAQKIQTRIQQPFTIAGKEFSIGASIGISACPQDGNDPETLIRHADIAMYRAKTEGKGRFRYYSPAMARSSLERYAMESALRHALVRGEMTLHFQPKVDLRSGRMAGAEALIRWNHPEHGLLSPAHFIPLAEDMGLIADIGLWTIREVCRRCREWQQQGLPPVRIAVNLAYSQFSDEYFFAKVEQLLRDFDLQPGVLELELTESMVMQHAERLMGTLQQLKRLGVHLSIDDFGTGYSSLAYLKRLPVDSVKIDRSFIKDLPLDAEDVTITNAVLALIHSLNRSVVAEGVETQEQLQFLIDHRCDTVQGFYFSPGVPDEEFRHMLADENCFAV